MADIVFLCVLKDRCKAVKDVKVGCLQDQTCPLDTASSKLQGQTFLWQAAMAIEIEPRELNVEFGLTCDTSLLRCVVSIYVRASSLTVLAS